MTWRDVLADVARHQRVTNPAVWPLLAYRFGRAAQTLPPPLRRVGSGAYGALAWSVELATGTRIDRETVIGEALHIVHSGNIKIHPAAVIGDRVGIMHDVTIGVQPGSEGAPRIGNDVFIGPGAKILGGITIGDGATISANSLVITDIPAGATAMGVPARPLPKRKGAP